MGMIPRRLRCPGQRASAGRAVQVTLVKGVCAMAKARLATLCCLSAVLLCFSAVGVRDARGKLEYAIVTSVCADNNISCTYCLTSVNQKVGGGGACYLTKCDSSDARFKTCQQATSPEATCYQLDTNTA